MSTLHLNFEVPRHRLPPSCWPSLAALPPCCRRAAAAAAALPPTLTPRCHRQAAAAACHRSDPIDIATDSPKIGLHEFNIYISIYHPTVDTCVDGINLTSSSQENEVFHNLGLFGHITDVITTNARQPRKQHATATITTSTRDLRASSRHMNPPSSNRGLKNSSVLCYLNSYFQVLASYRGLPDCLSQPPSDDDRCFPIYYKLATIISSIRSGQGEPICTEAFGVVHANVGQNVTPHNPSLGLFLYHFLHMMVSWHHESIHNNTNNQQTPPP